MEKGKTSRYLKYAVGEIILVVIGILIALQINNWNEDRKASLNERELLTYTLENLRTDSLSLVKLINKTNRILKVQDDLIELSKGTIKTEDIKDLDLIRGSEPNQIVTKKNNPNLPNEVKSLTLKKVILDYYLKVDWLEFTIINNNEIVEQSIRPFLGEKNLLNYGVTWKEDVSKLNLINRTRFFEEFKDTPIQQILFESGIKLSIMKRNAERTLEKNTELKLFIINYLGKDD